MSRRFISFVVLSACLVFAIHSAWGGYRWPRDGRKGAGDRDGFDYFVDVGDSPSESVPRSGEDYDGHSSGAGIGKDPNTGRWVVRPAPGVCAKLALHPQGDLVDSDEAARILGLSAMASGGDLSVKIMLVPSDLNGGPDMGSPEAQELFPRTVYDDGQPVYVFEELYETSITNCHWIVLEVDDASNPCNSSDTDDPTRQGGGDIDDGDGFPPDGDDWPPWDTPLIPPVTLPGEDDPPLFTYSSSLVCPIFSRLVVQPTTSEFIEIHNSSDFPFPLEEFYISNTNTYFYLPEKIRDATTTRALGGSGNLFTARFPDNAFIGPFEYRTIAITGSANFKALSNACPDFELYDDGDSDCTSTAVMREGFSGSINNQGNLADADGHLALFNWDAEAPYVLTESYDLVFDCDLLNWGDDTSVRTDKTGVSLDGPDSDSTESTYLNETDEAAQETIPNAPHAEDSAFIRSDFSEGTEVQTSGNGWLGQDETSENVGTTWTTEVLPDAVSEGQTAAGGSSGCSLIPF